MNKIVNSLMEKLTRETQVVLKEELDIANDKGFDITTLEGIKKVFTDNETVHQLLKYSYDKDDAQKALNDILEVLEAEINKPSNNKVYNVWTTSACNINKLILIDTVVNLEDDIAYRRFEESKGKIIKDSNDITIVYNDKTRTMYKQVTKYSIVKENLDNAVKKNGCKLLKLSLENSSNPHDWYLYSVLVYDIKKDEFVAWSYNADCDCLSNGKYCSMLEDAEKHYYNRIQG